MFVVIINKSIDREDFMKNLQLLFRILILAGIMLSCCLGLDAETITIQTDSETFVLDISDVAAIRFEGEVSAEDMQVLVPIINARLKQNYPNPFNPETTISFELEKDSQTPVSLSIYNAKGQLVTTLVNEPLASGPHCAVWSGEDAAGKIVSSGIYFYQLNVNKQLSTKKMILLK